MLRRVKAGPDGADHLAIDDNWQAALHFSEAARRNGSKATMVDRIFERLTRLLEQRCRSGLAWRKFHAGEIGGMVHALDQDRPPAVIDHRHNSGQVIAGRFRLGGRDDLSCYLQGQGLLFRKWSGCGRLEHRDRTEHDAAYDNYTHDGLLL